MEDTIKIIQAFVLIFFSIAVLGMIGGEVAKEAIEALDTLIWGLLAISSLSLAIYIFRVFR